MWSFAFLLISIASVSASPPQIAAGIAQVTTSFYQVNKYFPNNFGVHSNHVLNLHYSFLVLAR